MSAPGEPASTRSTRLSIAIRIPLTNRLSRWFGHLSELERSSSSTGRRAAARWRHSVEQGGHRGIFFWRTLTELQEADHAMTAPSIIDRPGSCSSSTPMPTPCAGRPGAGAPSSGPTSATVIGTATSTPAPGPTPSPPPTPSARGLSGVRLVTSDAPAGMVTAIGVRHCFAAIRKLDRRTHLAPHGDTTPDGNDEYGTCRGDQAILATTDAGSRPGRAAPHVDPAGAAVRSLLRRGRLAGRRAARTRARGGPPRHSGRVRDGVLRDLVVLDERHLVRLRLRHRRRPLPAVDPRPDGGGADPCRRCAGGPER